MVIRVFNWISSHCFNPVVVGSTESIKLSDSDGDLIVRFLILSGLFHRVIMMSGSALSPWSMSTPANAVKYSQELAISLNCPVEHKGFKKMVECLRHKNLNDILNHEPIGPTFTTIFGPTIDGVILPSDLIASMSSFDPVTGHLNNGRGKWWQFNLILLKLWKFLRKLGIFWEFTGNFMGAIH